MCGIGICHPLSKQQNLVHVFYKVFFGKINWFSCCHRLKFLNIVIILSALKQSAPRNFLHPLCSSQLEQKNCSSPWVYKLWKTSAG